MFPTQKNQSVPLDISFSSSLFSRQAHTELNHIISHLEAAPRDFPIILKTTKSHSDYHLHWLQEIAATSIEDLKQQCEVSLDLLKKIRLHSNRLVFLSEHDCIGSICILAALCALRVLTKPGRQFGCDEFERGHFLPTEYRSKRRRSSVQQSFEFVATPRGFAGGKTMGSDWLLLDLDDFWAEKTTQLFENFRKSNALSSVVTEANDNSESKKKDATLLLAEQFSDRGYQEFLVHMICHAGPPIEREFESPTFVYMNVSSDHLPFRFVARNLLSGAFTVLQASHHDEILRYMNLASYQLTRTCEQSLAEKLWFHRTACVVSDNIEVEHPHCTISGGGFFQISLAGQVYEFYLLGSTKEGHLALEDHRGHVKNDGFPKELYKFLKAHCICIPNPVFAVESLNYLPLAKIIRLFIVIEMLRLRKQEGVFLHDVMDALEANGEHRRTIRMSWIKSIQQLDEAFLNDTALLRFSRLFGIEIPPLGDLKDLLDYRLTSSFTAVKKQEWTNTLVIRHLRTLSQLLVKKIYPEGGSANNLSLSGLFFYWSTGLYDPVCALWNQEPGSLQKSSKFHAHKYWPKLVQASDRDFFATKSSQTVV